jgi:hypothetical protein
MAATLPLVADGIEVLITAIQSAETIAGVIKQAQAAGQTVLTDAQWAQITGNEASAEGALSAAIAAAKAKGQ